MPGGRPLKYKKEFAKQVEVACRLGATQADLAELFEVSLECIKKWMVRYPEFKKAYDTYREVADSEIERSLYERARGYSCIETDIRVIDGEIVTTNIVKHYPPDTTAAIYWLKNRKRHKWKDKWEEENAGKQNTPININIVDAKKPE